MKKTIINISIEDGVIYENTAEKVIISYSDFTGEKCAAGILYAYRMSIDNSLGVFIKNLLFYKKNNYFEENIEDKIFLNYFHTDDNIIFKLTLDNDYSVDEIFCEYPKDIASLISLYSLISVYIFSDLVEYLEKYYSVSLVELKKIILK